MNDLHRLRQLQRIDDAMAHNERMHTPEEVAAATEDYFAQRSGRRCVDAPIQQPQLPFHPKAA